MQPPPLLTFSFLLISICFSLSSCTLGTSISDEAVTPSKEWSWTLIPDPKGTPLTKVLLSPIDQAGGRTTKKLFGTQVSPGHSTVSPEKFTGYHTGVDFETFSREKESDIKISAACTGKIVLKKQASGYGGVVVQRCDLPTETVTIIYGHLKLDSITPVVGTILQAHDKIWILGKGYSDQTDGERKHLHFGIHKWPSINITWYTSTSGALNNWIDPIWYLQ